MSLRRRLVLLLAPLFILGLAVADVVTYTSLRSFLLARVDTQLDGAQHAVWDALRAAAGIQPEGPEGGGPRGPGGPGAIPVGAYGELRRADGSVAAAQSFYVAQPGITQQPDSSTHPVLPSDLRPGSPTSPTYLEVAGAGSVGRYRLSLSATPDNSADTLIVGVPIDDVDSTLQRLLVVELAVSGSSVVAVGSATWLLVRRGMRPLEDMADTAQSIVASDLSRRIAPATESTEVGRLGLALNSMLAQLEGAFAERVRNEARLRHFIADASHELRTPLTSIRGYAELLRINPSVEAHEHTSALRRIEDEATRMSGLVDDLLLLARLEQRRTPDLRPVDLESVVRDEGARAAGLDHQRALSVRVDAPARVLGDEPRLRQAVRHLLRNALVHTPDATPVEVVLREEDGSAVIEVVDHGSGIAPADAAGIFEPWHRVDVRRGNDRGGSGLGLSVVAAVVAAHGGRVSVDRTAGGGATFRVALLLAAEVDAAPTAPRRTAS